MSLYNMLCGVNPLYTIFLGMLDLELDQVPRFRDVFLHTVDGGEVQIAVFTRMGGGNRGHYEDGEPGEDCECNGCRAEYVLGQHPLYVEDFDDDFDSTYATYVFRTPPAYQDALKGLTETTQIDASHVQELLRRLLHLSNGTDAPQGMEKLRPTLQKLEKAFNEAGANGE